MTTLSELVVPRLTQSFVNKPRNAEEWKRLIDLLEPEINLGDGLSLEEVGLADPRHLPMLEVGGNGTEECGECPRNSSCLGGDNCMVIKPVRN